MARFLSLAIGLLACSEGNSDPPDAGRSDSGPTASDTGSPLADSTVAPDAGVSPGPSDGAAPATDAPLEVLVSGAVIINELRGRGDDWIELYNTGATAVSLEGYRIADANDDGSSRIEMAVTFPAGAMIAPNGYFMVVADVAMPMPGLPTDCVDAAITSCVHAPWGITGGGDTIRLYDAMGTLVAREMHPGSVPDGQSWGRLPSGSATAAFANNAPTPNAENRAAM